MSVTLTEQAVIDRRKTVTRRLGWWTDRNGRRLLHEGDRLTLCRKVMGRRHADGTVDPLVRLAEVDVISVRREPVFDISPDDISAEGVDPAVIAAHGGEIGPDGQPSRWAWIDWFCAAQRCGPYDLVTRIEWLYRDEVTP